MARNGSSSKRKGSGKTSASRERKKANGKGAAARKPKPSVEQLSDQQRQALCFAHARKLKPLLAAKKESADAVTKAFEQAKKEGITRKEIDLKIALETGEGIEKVKVEVERTQRMVRWMGVGKQLDMFGDGETQAQRHFEDGRRAALDDQPAKPPEHLSQKDGQTWLAGHTAGRTSLNESRIRGGIRTLGDIAADVTATLGTEAPTHREAA